IPSTVTRASNMIRSFTGRVSLRKSTKPPSGRLRISKISIMNYPAASYGVSKTARNEASFGEYDPERLFKLKLPSLRTRNIRGPGVRWS
ncbi:MAG: hypothetical protein KJ663_05035, partial [Proteobacteria bacterium]|nr:hypothetical protein [Pseudomonadota bacterium]